VLKHRISVACAAIVAVAAMTALTPAALARAPSVAPLPGYLTIQFGRAMEGSYNPVNGSPGCSPVPGILSLTQIAEDLTARGMTATAAVVVAYTGASSEMCYHANIYADWADLQTLTSDDGWAVVSAGLTYTDITQLTPAQQLTESCGSLPSFTAEGLSANGLFAYPDNQYNATVQSTVVSTCFYYGRTYQGGVNDESTMNPNGFQASTSITGGACEMVGAPCHQPIKGQKGKHYTSPVKLEGRVASEGDNQWIDLQFYKLVSGTGHDGMYSWDCTSSNPSLHWSSQPELYCQNDFDAILSSVPAGVVVTDPASVAAAWGRVLG